ncbi:MAG: N-6 DNA methylase [Planctomycetes bacterium]|nr:N-6 DNA methylase [Planctomycetota bacterium]
MTGKPASDWTDWHDRLAQGGLQLESLVDLVANADFQRQPATTRSQILGQIYERLQDNQDASSKKRRGVYYTPKLVVDYIVCQTLDRLWGQTNPTGLPRLRVLDPACGAGSFLIGVYEKLLDWHLQWYTHDPQRWLRRTNPPITTAAKSGDFRLTFRERARILRDSVFGVDTDPHAVEVAKLALSFLLSADTHGARARDRCRKLDANIQCGDSLLDSSFDWQERFPRVMQSGGFDAIVGNPPYLNIRLVHQAYGKEVTQYLRQRFRTASGNFDIFVVFIERSLNLLRPNGRLGMIVPNKLATLEYARECRRMLLEETEIDQIVDVSEMNLFAGAGVYPHIIVCENSPPRATHRIRLVTARHETDLAAKSTRSICQSSLSADGFALHGTLDVESRVATKPLAERAMLHSGTTGFIAQQVARRLREKSMDTDGFEFIVSGNIDRYRISLGNVRFMKRVFRRPILGQDGLSARKQKLYSDGKIVVAGMTRRLEAALDTRGIALGVQVYAATHLSDDPHFLLALLNSKLLSHLFRLRFQAKQLAGGYLAINKGQLAQLPIRSIDQSNPVEANFHDELVELAKHIVKCNEGLLDDRERQADVLLRSTADADRRIDEIVFQLYDVTACEIRDLDRLSLFV